MYSKGKDHRSRHCDVCGEVRDCCRVRQRQNGVIRMNERFYCGN